MVAPYAAINPIAAGTKGAAIFIPVTNAIERLHEEFKRRIKTQTVLPSADTAAMLFWDDGWNTLSTVSSDQPQLDAAA
jgi:putative transposase